MVPMWILRTCSPNNVAHKQHIIDTGILGSSPCGLQHKDMDPLFDGDEIFNGQQTNHFDVLLIFKKS